MKVYIFLYILIFTYLNVISQVSNTSSKPNKYKFNDGLNFKINIGANSTGVHLYYYYPGKNSGISDGVINIKLGLEAEYVIPLFNKHWGVFIDPSYFYFNWNNDSWASSTSEINIKYEGLQLPIGFRYYLIPESKYNFFLEGLFNSYINFIANPKVDYINPIYNDLRINAKGNLGYGFGININRISLTLRNNLINNLYRDKNWDSGMHVTSLTFGCKFF